MLRFLRQYNKIFLGVFGVLLLFAWAVGGSISQLSSYAAREGTAWATIGPDDRKVTIGELEHVRSELNVLDYMKKAFTAEAILPIQGIDSTPAQWYLATKEAEEAGLVGGELDATRDLDLIAKALSDVFVSEGLEPSADTAAAIIGARSGATGLTVRRTIAKLNGIRRLRDVILTMGTTSDVRLRANAKALLTGAACDLVVLDARSLALPPVAAPTEADLEAQLKEFGADAPGSGERGFGYRLPNRVRFEWLQVRESQVRSAVAAGPGLDSLSLKKRFAENPAKFGVGLDVSDPLSVFPQYEATVRSTVVNELVAERMREIAKFASDIFAQAQRGLKRDSSGLYALPADWASVQPSFESVAAEIAAQFKVEAPTYGSTGTIARPVDDIKTMPGIGSASTTQFGDRPMTLTNIVERLKAFTPPEDVPLSQVGITLPPLTGTNKDVYLVRVTDALPSEPPTSVDEVRAALVRDVTALERYNALASLADELKTRADSQGLVAVATEYGTTVQVAPNVREVNPQILGFGAKVGMPLPVLGTDEKASREIVRRAMEMAAKAPKGEPIASLPAEERTFVLPLADRLTVLVVRVTDLLPLTQEEFQPLVADVRVHALLSDDGYMGALRDAFSLESLMARHNFKPARGRDESGNEVDDGAEAEKPTSASAG